MRYWFIVVFLVVEVLCQNSMVSYAKENVERFSGIYNTREEIPEAEREFTAPGGACYELKNSELEEFFIPERTEPAESRIIYEAVGKSESIPELSKTRIKDEESQTELTVSLPLEGRKYVRERWQSFQFRITFHEYEADAYLLNGIILKGATALEELEERPELVLEIIGLDGTECRALAYEWEGEPYLDDLGSICRDVMAAGEQKVWDCRAIYAGNVTFPGYSRYRMRYSYMTKENKTDIPESMDFSGDDTWNNEEGQTQLPPNPLIRKLVVCLEVTVGILFIILLVLGFRLLLHFVRKLKEKNRQD